MAEYKIKTKNLKFKAKRVFLTKGTCSHTFFHLINREFGFPMKEEERAIDPLAGGILQQGYQCGMLWGASMAVGAEAYRRYKDIGLAISITVKATQLIMESFKERTDTLACEEITNCDFNNKKSFAKYMLSGKFLACYNLAGKWAPEAIKAAVEGLTNNTSQIHGVSCASQLIKKMGGDEKQQVMVAGFAGGLGLSGDGCGALSAAIWKSILELVKKGDWKYKINDEFTQDILNRFFEETEYQIECKDITGKSFRNISEHTDFIEHGGCSNLIDLLANMKTEKSS